MRSVTSGERGGLVRIRHQHRGDRAWPRPEPRRWYACKRLEFLHEMRLVVVAEVERGVGPGFGGGRLQRVEHGNEAHESAKELRPQANNRQEAPLPLLVIAIKA